MRIKVFMIVIFLYDSDILNFIIFLVMFFS
jgi:hypothetical protein